jgi:hypothetical protein
MKTYLLGDIHGKWALLNKFIKDHNPCQLINVGDFGIFHSDPVLNMRDSQLLFIDGNHENHDRLQVFTNPVELYPGITYLPRGTYKTIHTNSGEYNCLFMGGASSIDAKYRTPFFDWWPQEIISDKDIRTAEQNVNGPVDIIFSHTVPNEFSVVGNLDLTNFDITPDPSQTQLSYLLKYQPKKWYAGHWHAPQSGNYNGTEWKVLSDIPNKGFYCEL